MRERIRRKMEANAAKPDRRHPLPRRYPSRYGISRGEFSDLVDAQHSRCPVCQEPLTGRIVVDHCHRTKKVRGILHQRCNVALGLLGDNPDTLLRGAQYLSQ